MNARFQVGYNAEEIRAFIPRELRKLAECDHADLLARFILAMRNLSKRRKYDRDHKISNLKAPQGAF